MEDDPSGQTASTGGNHNPIKMIQKPIPMDDMRRQKLNNLSMMIWKQRREGLPPKNLYHWNPSVAIE